jgi:hypothetical protein
MRQGNGGLCGLSFGFLQKTKTLKMASLSDGRDILKGFCQILPALFGPFLI